jgi:hypothetical protein
MDWRLVQELDAVDGLLQEDQARRQGISQRQMLKNQLNAQRAEFHRRNAGDQDDERRWGYKLQADANSFWQEQNDKREADREAQQRFNQEQTRLLEAKNRRRMMEKERDMEIEREMRERAVMARKIEVAKDEEKKKRTKAEAKKCQKEREQAAEVKKEQKRQEAIKDMELLEVQKAVMDKQERARHEKTEKFREDQARRMAQFEATAGNESAELQRKDDQRMKMAVEERTKKEQQEHQEKLLKLQKEKEQSKASVRSQLEERNERRAKEREESLRQRKEFQREAEAAIAEEKNKEQQRRDKARENAAFLLSQMEERSAMVPGRFGHEQMSAVEKSINRDRYSRATSNESLQLLFRSKQLQYRLAAK